MEKGFILSLIFAAIIAVFALNNSGMVLINLLFTEIEMSQAIIIFVSALFGAVIVAILGWVKSYKINKDLKDHNKGIDKIMEDNKALSDLLAAKDEEIAAKDEEILAKNEEIAAKAERIRTLSANFMDNPIDSDETPNNN